MRETRAYLGLGSNLGDRVDAIRMACNTLGAHPEITVERLSSLYETPPVGMTDQPDFVNAVAEVLTALSARDLLAICLEIEAHMGRVRNVRWGPRVIDIDILVYGTEVVDEADLTVPHARLSERAFALAPLAELAPDLQPPGFSGKVTELLAMRDDRTVVRRIGKLDIGNLDHVAPFRFLEEAPGESISG